MPSRAHAVQAEALSLDPRKCCDFATCAEQELGQLRPYEEFVSWQHCRRAGCTSFRVSPRCCGLLAVVGSMSCRFEREILTSKCSLAAQSAKPTPTRCTPVCLGLHMKRYAPLHELAGNFNSQSCSSLPVRMHVHVRTYVGLSASAHEQNFATNCRADCSWGEHHAIQLDSESSGMRKICSEGTNEIMGSVLDDRAADICM